MTRIVIGIVALLALVSAIGYALDWYGDVRVEQERAATAKRAEGIKAEREVLDEKLRNQTVAERCERFGLDYVRDDQGERCA